MIIIEGKSGSGKTKKLIEWAKYFNGDVAVLYEEDLQRYAPCKAVSYNYREDDRKTDIMLRMAAKTNNIAIDLNGVGFDERELLELEHKLGLNIAITKQCRKEISVLNVAQVDIDSNEQNEVIEDLQQRVAVLEGEVHELRDKLSEREVLDAFEKAESDKWKNLEESFSSLAKKAELIEGAFRKKVSLSEREYEVLKNGTMIFPKGIIADCLHVGKHSIIRTKSGESIILF